MKIHKIKRRKNWFKFLIKWFFVGFLPQFIIMSIWDYREGLVFTVDYDKTMWSIVCSPIMYFFIPWFIKINKELWEMFKVADIRGKIFLIVGFIMLVGRMVWMISHTPK